VNCHGTVTRRPSWGGKPYRVPCDKLAAFELAGQPDSDHLIRACRVHLPDLVTQMTGPAVPSVDVRPVTR
jgi:hypothetical protein